MKKSSMVFLLAAALAGSVPAWAHTDEYLDTVRAPHGGSLRMAGPYHLELIIQPGELTVYITDHAGMEQGTQGTEGKATVKSGLKEVSVELEPAGKNVLKGKGDFKLGADTVVVVTFKLPAQEVQAARFTPLKANKGKRPGAQPKQGEPGRKDDHQHGSHAHE